MNIPLSEIIFVCQLRKSSTSSILRTIWHEKDCILKVYHATKPSPADPPNREINPFKCESTAFVRLQEFGLCARGSIPDFYGIIENIKPVPPYMKDFLEDALPPNAVLMEYIPDMQFITPSL
ncbi:hypothetical protein BO94DRAFT_602192 [Aspergillus sclerotioniger CBS 115572]|uniref:Uncharacterized protein n=1 Tax=Aspergillus sclerotioniger CBS 115572 TaxID=1450535 RepID=A0A317W2L7_9EURO|nr:hypothetical protein BO94DRAFT_602192 [Aspergillus sclerotioniger CBS 115572]PWY80834.1 hypothetical protein BO94DRAFT_602192 [Aspergillus sclerotioniger CBS 115572]